MAATTGRSEPLMAVLKADGYLFDRTGPGRVAIPRPLLNYPTSREEADCIFGGLAGRGNRHDGGPVLG